MLTASGGEGRRLKETHSGASVILAIETKVLLKLLASCQTAIHTLSYHTSFAVKFLNCEAHSGPKAKDLAATTSWACRTKNLKLFSKLQCHAIHVNPALPVKVTTIREESKVFQKRHNKIPYNS